MAEPKHGSIWEALYAVQSAAPTLQKSAINPHFKSKYVPLDTLMEAVTPLLAENELVWITRPGYRNTDAGLEAVLDYELHHIVHTDEVTGTMLLLPGKRDPQGQGSAITYARRYALMAVLGLVADEDDDGNAASPAPRPRRAPAGRATQALLPATRNRLKAAREAINADTATIGLMLTSLGLDPKTPSSQLTDEQGRKLADLLEKEAK